MKLSILFLALFALGGLTTFAAIDTNRMVDIPPVIPSPSSALERQTKPPFDSYKGVSIGMSTVDVRAKLGKPKEESDAEDDFVFSESESVRVFYDANKTVRVISIMYTGDKKLAPAPKAIVGTDIEAKPDGGMHKTVQYPKAGFWISYVRTGGNDAIVLVTIQKMAKE